MKLYTDCMKYQKNGKSLQEEKSIIYFSLISYEKQKKIIQFFINRCQHFDKNEKNVFYFLHLTGL